MAVKQVWTDLDGMSVGILKNWRPNPLSTSAIATLAGTLNAAHQGLQVFNTDTNVISYWDGTTFVSGVAPLIGAMTYKGTYGSLVAEPGSAVVGDTYVMITAGALAWPGITFTPDSTVQVGDIVVKRSATEYDIIQGNSVNATELVAGIVELATQTEVNTGTDDARAITPLKLQSWATTKAFAKTYFASAVNLVANTAFTITHNLSLQNAHSFVCSVKDAAGSEIILDVDASSINSCTVTSSVAITGATVTIIGF